MMAQAALAGDVIERVWITCPPCGNCRQAILEHNYEIRVDFESLIVCSMEIDDLIPEGYRRSIEYTPPAYVHHENLLIDKANYALSTCQAYRSGVAEACAIEAFDGRIFAAARNEWCSYPGDAFTLAFGAMVLQDCIIPKRVHWKLHYPSGPKTVSMDSRFLPALLELSQYRSSCKIVVNECSECVVHSDWSAEWSPKMAYLHILGQEFK
jgi:hypothetical protein